MYEVGGGGDVSVPRASGREGEPGGESVTKRWIRSESRSHSRAITRITRGGPGCKRTRRGGGGGGGSSATRKSRQRSNTESCILNACAGRAPAGLRHPSPLALRMETYRLGVCMYISARFSLTGYESRMMCPELLGIPKIPARASALHGGPFFLPFNCSARASCTSGLSSFAAYWNRLAGFLGALVVLG